MQVIKSISRYFGGYLLGIIAGILFSPADIILGGHWLLLHYVIGALPGFIFVIYYAIFEPGFVFWFYLITVGFLPLWIRLYFRFRRKTDEQMTRLMIFRPLWTTFPIGFLGTLGIYAAVLESI